MSDIPINYGEVDVCAADRFCDEKLAEAGLTPRWLPTELPVHIVQGGNIVRELIDRTKPLTDLQIEKIQRFGSDVRWLVTKMIPNSGDSFRAKTAIDNGKGNCISRQEGVSGIMAACGLSQRSLGIWRRYAVSNVAHAYNVVAGTRFALEIDQTTTCNLSGDGSDLHAIYKAIADRDVPGATTIASAGSHVYPANTLTLDAAALHTLDIVKNVISTRRIIMPASLAVVIFCGAATKNSTDLENKYANAGEVLADFTPIL